MTRQERDALLEASVPVDPDDPESRRFAVRRVDGRIELYEAQCGGVRDGEEEFHGYPWYHPEYRPNPRPVPYSVLDRLCALGHITQEEFRKALRGKLFV
jgi:hypothetical protein